MSKSSKTEIQYMTVSSESAELIKAFVRDAAALAAVSTFVIAISSWALIFAAIK